MKENKNKIKQKKNSILAEQDGINDRTSNEIPVPTQQKLKKNINNAWKVIKLKLHFIDDGVQHHTVYILKAHSQV